MRKVLAILRSWYVCFRAEIGVATYSNLITTANVAKRLSSTNLIALRKFEVTTVFLRGDKGETCKTNTYSCFFACVSQAQRIVGDTHN